MRIAICDDEEKYIYQVKELIEHLYHSLEILIDTYQNGNELLSKYDKYSYDVVILDIEMPTVNGISLARKLRQKSEEVVLIFLTGHVEYALQGYEVNALRYLTKPVKSEKLKEVLDYVIEKMRKKRTLWVKTAEGEEKILVTNILYMEARNQNVEIHTDKKSYSVRYNIGNYEQELEKDGFYRVHRSYLISLGKVKCMGKNQVELCDGTLIPVSRSKEKKLREALYEYVKKEAI